MKVLIYSNVENRKQKGERWYLYELSGIGNASSALDGKMAACFTKPFFTTEGLPRRDLGFYPSLEWPCSEQVQANLQGLQEEEGGSCTFRRDTAILMYLIIPAGFIKSQHEWELLLGPFLHQLHKKVATLCDELLRICTESIMSV